MLDKLLLHREESIGINIDGGTPKFIGAVSQESANEFIAKKKHNFSEDEQVSTLLLHGKYSHRLMLEAFRFAGIHEVNSLSFPQLLELLVTVKYENQYLWEVIFDTAEDVIEPLKSKSKFHEENLNPDYYNFSSRFPFVFKSLIVCFGQHIGLPNLQSYLLDSHWKESYRMVGRVTENNNDLEKNRVYTYCMEALTNIYPTGDIGRYFPFTLSGEHARAHPKYQPYYEGSGSIVKKVSEPHSVGEYHSWDDYILQTKDIPYISPEMQFLEACCSGSVDTICTLIKSQSEKLHIIWHGLQLAIENNRKEVIALVLNEKIITSRDLQFFLVSIAESGHNEILKLFLDQGVNINFANNKKRSDRYDSVIRSPLIAAVKTGQYETVVLLLEHGINFECDCSPFHLNTALTTAIKYGHKNIAQLLLERNPSRAWLCVKNSDGKNAHDLLQEKQETQWGDIRVTLNELLDQNPTLLNQSHQEFNKATGISPEKVSLVEPTINLKSTQWANQGIEAAQKNSLKEQLNNYINRIEVIQNKNFSHGFLFFKQSRAMNRQANYLLAQSFLQQLNEGSPLHAIFSHINEQRNRLIHKNDLDANSNRGINSRHLNRVIVTAQKYVRAQNAKIEAQKKEKEDESNWFCRK